MRGSRRSKCSGLRPRSAAGPSRSAALRSSNSVLIPALPPNCPAIWLPVVGGAPNFLKRITVIRDREGGAAEFFRKDRSRRTSASFLGRDQRLSWASRLAVWRFAGFAERVKIFKVTSKQCFLLGPRPALQLSFAGSRFREGRKCFEAKECRWRIEVSCSACLAGDVIFETLSKVL